MLDETHARLTKKNGNRNKYILGKVEVHNVIITCLLASLRGNSPTAIVINNI